MAGLTEHEAGRNTAAAGYLLSSLLVTLNKRRSANRPS